MARKFSTIAFTDSVKALQERFGSRESYKGFDTVEDEGTALSEREVAFMRARDSFYMATISETGWPYVQHRGGPPGFLKVLDDTHLGFADFRGNRQYISVGNLSSDDRVSLILMDYQHRRRLKVWGRTTIIDETNEPHLLASLEMPHYRGRVERGIVIRVEAWDWNCPQHITQRYTADEVEDMLRSLQQENAELKAKLDNLVRHN